MSGPLGPRVSLDVANERGEALLHALVPAEAFKTMKGSEFYTWPQPQCGCRDCAAMMKKTIIAIEVVGSFTSNTYWIRTDCYASNIRNNTTNRMWCAHPNPYHDFPSNSERQATYDYNTVIEVINAGFSPILPTGDLVLGQYLTIKYNERAFLDKAIG